MKYKHNLYTLLILFCAMFVAQNVVAQVKGINIMKLMRQ